VTLGLFSFPQMNISLPRKDFIAGNPAGVHFPGNRLERMKGTNLRAKPFFSTEGGGFIGRQSPAFFRGNIRKSGL